MRQCKSSGIDCKVHGLSIIGHLKSDEEDQAANFRYLASDNEDQDRPLTSATNKKQKPITSQDIKTHVFVWGLNDKDQLGGPKGSKVRPVCVTVYLTVISWLYRTGSWRLIGRMSLGKLSTSVAPHISFI